MLILKAANIVQCTVKVQKGKHLYVACVSLLFQT